MRVGITVFLLPIHKPVEMAEQVATRDAISHGKMIFGVGLGYRAEECEAAGGVAVTRRDAIAAGLGIGFPMIVPSSVFGENAPSNRVIIGAIGAGRISRSHDTTDSPLYTPAAADE